MSSRYDRARRPPWWPEEEPFPPDRGYWRRRRRGRYPRYLLLVPLFMFLFVVVFVGTFAWIGAQFGPWHLFLAIVALAVLLSGLTRAFVGPIGSVLDAVRQVGEGDYGVRVPERGTRRMRELASSFNAMVERLAAHDEQRRRLLADVSHELRTPLTVMQGQLEGLLDGVYPRDDARLQSLLEETRVMSRVIEDLRTLSLAEAGTLELHLEPVDVRVLLEDVATSFRAQADTAGVRLVVDAPAPLPALELDPTRMRQVLGNLVSNALRYTPASGSVTLAATRAGDAVRIDVRDTGAGIAPDALPHVFERYWRSADSRGSGLGLPIAKSIVDAHGGAISAASGGSGQGTTISLTVPA